MSRRRCFTTGSRLALSTRARTCGIRASLHLLADSFARRGLRTGREPAVRRCPPPAVCGDRRHLEIQPRFPAKFLAMPWQRWKSWKGWTANSACAHEGSIIATQETPPGPVFLRNGHQPPEVPPVAAIGVNHWDERWTAHLGPLAAIQEPEADQPDFTGGEVAAAPPASVAPRSRPSFRRSARKQSRKPGVRACHCGQ